jgi:thiamine-monophosphate kinase
LTELAEASHVGIEVEWERVPVRAIVARVAAARGLDPRDIIFNGGADFSLIGTLHASAADSVADTLGHDLTIIGRVVEGSGIWMRDSAGVRRLEFRGWNYCLGRTPDEKNR